MGSGLYCLPILLWRMSQKFLDDVTLAELTDALQVDVYIVESSGADFIHAVIGDDM